MSTFDDELTLISYENGTNDIGDAVRNSEKRKEILCDIKSVNRSEFYAAARNDMRPEAVFEVNKYDYDGEKIVEQDGQRYDVLRSFMSTGKQSIENFETIELICQGVSINGTS